MVAKARGGTRSPKPHSPQPQPRGPRSAYAIPKPAIGQASSSGAGLPPTHIHACSRPCGAHAQGPQLLESSDA
eukprot:scaffold66034_cov66-Phaeocystis_antarctica.AAC.9